jgi:hypothetical protein
VPALRPLSPLYRSPLGLIDRGFQQISKPLNVHVSDVGEVIHRRSPLMGPTQAVADQGHRLPTAVGLAGVHGLRITRKAELILFKIAHSEPVLDVLKDVFKDAETSDIATLRHRLQ